MSFYWEKGLQQQDTGQPAQQQGQWDFINLGGAPAPQHQWNPSVQQQQPQHQQQTNYYYQSAPSQPQQPHTNHSAQQQQYNVNSQHQQSAEQNYQQQQWMAQQQSQHQPPPSQQAQTQQTQHQPQKPKKAQQTVIEHTPLLPPAQQVQQVQPQAQQAPNFTPAPPVLAPSFQPVESHQQYYQQQPQQQSQPMYQQYVNSKPEETAAPAYYPPPPVTQLGSAPASKEVTPEPQTKPMAPAVQVAPVTQKQAAPTPKPPVLAPPTTTPVVPKKEEHLTVAAPIVIEDAKPKVTPTSSEDDWEKADMEIQRVEDENKRQKASQVAPEKPEESRESSSLGGSWATQDTEPSERSSVEPVEIVEHPVSIEVDIEEKTPRVSVSENQATPTIVNMSISLSDDRQETPEAGHPNQSTSVVINSSSSPLEAIATSTPKDMRPEKRSSVSSQGTIGTEKSRSKKNTEKSERRNYPDMFNKHEPQNHIVEKEEESGNNSDSTMASGRPEFVRGEARASYREYKKTYHAIVDRLNFMRANQNHSDFRPSSKLANPLLAAAGLSRQHPAIRRESLGARNDGRASVPLHHSHSFNDNIYSEQNGGRRSRVSRLDPSGRPSSRHAPGYASVNHSQINPYDQRGYAQQQNPLFRHGRHSAMAGQYDPRRPYGAEQYPGAVYGQEPQEASSISESDEDEGESDYEIQGYNMHHRQAPSEHSYHPSQGGDDEGKTLYYCGVVHVNMDLWYRIKEKTGIPAGFANLNSIQKAAFMFYTVVFKQPYPNVETFHNRFNREFFRYKCDGQSEDAALFQICRTMQEQYEARRKEKELAYQNMKATLFSDENSIDGVNINYPPYHSSGEPPKSIMLTRQSENNSVYAESLNACDVYNNGPLKFSCPHSFLNISHGGQIISIQPDQSISAVVFDDIKSVLRDIPTLQIKDAAMSFKGPLIPHQSASHTVRLYITKQIENIKRSAVAMENPEANDVVESLLVWQLLETMVKQQGNITGPDIAEILAKVASQPVNIEAPPQMSNITPALNQFTQFLLGGHIDEAVESAMRNGLFADALVLTRRLFPNDERKIEQIESRFLQTRSMNNPVTTLVSVAKGEVPPVLTNPPLDDHLSWRTHAAIILANLDQRGTALSTIHQLGRALAKRDYHSAADFCFLVCGVLGGEKENPFTPVPTPEGEEDYRRYISLVNSDIPDNEANPKCQYGFLLTDLHATEIFDYALRLKPDRESLLATSVEYQTARIKYAKLLANHGFTTDAYRYCTEVARAIWVHITLFCQDDLLELCDLADSLHHRADVNPEETQWIESLRAIAQAGYGRASPTTTTIATTKQENTDGFQSYGYEQHPETVYDAEPLQPTPLVPTAPELAPTPIPSAFTAPIPSEHQTFEHQTPPEIAQQHQQNHFHEDVRHAPATPTGSVHQEQHAQQYESPFSYHSTPQEQFQYPDDGFTTPPDFNDGPLTMASSPQASAPQLAEQPAASPPLAAQAPPPPQQYQQYSDQQQQQQPLQQHENQVQNQLNSDNKNQSQGWLKTIQTKVQKALPGQNPMNLPEDKNPTIVWDESQKKYIGAGVEPEPVAPPPPTASSAPAPPTGGGLRAARGVSRYAKVGLGNSPSNASQALAGMMPQAPPTASFGFMPAPVDDDADSVDPFSGQANPTIQQSAPRPVDD
ncbi:hypothetical protein GCK72_025343 [Caenorhabditis remanei]|uniref:Protein transport protein sec16 n=1 Tax=Caenorhabditis remanei TaxID=31234 RepID=A0A6A5G1Q7_CAERE|nr:hypothetical protein GCK72_025343 [Caenorhabditis remanei]KAF1748876.1 hypothetical protein GCK72_025343 [Caenorhabditis remanei]